MGASVVAANVSTAPEAKVHSVTHSHPAKNALALASNNHSQQNPMQANDAKVENTVPATETQDPTDVMILPRYGKAIDAASKHEIVVSGKDRL